MKTKSRIVAHTIYALHKMIEKNKIIVTGGVIPPLSEELKIMVTIDLANGLKPSMKQTLACLKFLEDILKIKITSNETIGIS